LLFELFACSSRHEVVEKLSVYLVAIRRPLLKFRIPLSLAPIMPTIHPSGAGNGGSGGNPRRTWDGPPTRRYQAAIEHWGPPYAKARSSAERETIARTVYSELVGSGLQFLAVVGGGGPNDGATRTVEWAGEERATERIKRSLDEHTPDPPQPDQVRFMTDANTGRRSVAGEWEDKGSVEEAWSHADGGPRRLVTGNEAPAGAPLPGLAEVNLLPQGSGHRPMAEVEANGAEGKKKRDAEAAAAAPTGPETHRRRTDSGGAVGATRHSPSPSSAGVPTAGAVVFVVPRNVGVNPSNDRRRSPGVAAPASGPPQVAPGAGRRADGMSQEEEEEEEEEEEVGARAAIEGQQLQRAVPDGELRALRGRMARRSVQARMAAHDAERRALRARVAALEGALRDKDDMIRAKDAELRALRGLVSTLWGGAEKRRQAPPSG
jgi:hypothetical protein